MVWRRNRLEIGMKLSTALLKVSVPARLSEAISVSYKIQRLHHTTGLLNFTFFLALVSHRLGTHRFGSSDKKNILCILPVPTYAHILRHQLVL